MRKLKHIVVLKSGRGGGENTTSNETTERNKFRPNKRVGQFITPNENVKRSQDWNNEARPYHVSMQILGWNSHIKVSRNQLLDLGKKERKKEK